MVEFSPATRETRVQFPASAMSFVFLSYFFPLIILICNYFFTENVYFCTFIFFFFVFLLQILENKHIKTLFQLFNSIPSMVDMCALQIFCIIIIIIFNALG